MSHELVSCRYLRGLAALAPLAMSEGFILSSAWPAGLVLYALLWRRYRLCIACNQCLAKKESRRACPCSTWASFFGLPGPFFSARFASELSFDLLKYSIATSILFQCLFSIRHVLLRSFSRSALNFWIATLKITTTHKAYLIINPKIRGAS